jgi:hypothetical protein
METPDPVTRNDDALSIHRTFVVRLYVDPDPAHGRVCGRVEHVVSGEGAEFRSTEELLRFMGRRLDRCHGRQR